MKDNKGFTLAEVLGVIIILGLLIVVSFPPLLNQLKKSQKTLNDATLKIIGTAAEQYIDEHATEYPIVDTNVYCIGLNTLVTGGYIKSPIIDASTNEAINEETNVIEFKIISKNNYEYALKDKDECITKKV